jgi:autotransporter passenger strand-loop-strand repeat protein
MSTQFVSSGVVSSGVIITSGNQLQILSSGTANATSVTSGGTEQVDFGGTASGTVINSGGYDFSPRRSDMSRNAVDGRQMRAATTRAGPIPA